MPLSLAATDRGLRVVGINAGFGLQRQLADMGLIPGVHLKVVCRQVRGPVLIDLKGSRLAIGKGMAHKIMVEEEQK
jgi:Fe2+ transport system protein FeoA